MSDSSRKTSADWHFFPNTTFEHIDTFDCNDAVEGVCYPNLTLDQCVRKCGEHKSCRFGYYYSGLSRGKGAVEDTICVPIRDLFPDANPMYRLRNKDTYEELKNASSTTFFKKDAFPFPPNDAAHVFFRDDVLLVNDETKTVLSGQGFPTPDEPSALITFNKDTGDETQAGKAKAPTKRVVQMLQIPPSPARYMTYTKVRYGDTFTFHLPDTNLVMRRATGYQRGMEWVYRAFDLTQLLEITIDPVLPNRKIGDFLMYSDPFCMWTDGFILGLDDANRLGTYYYNSWKDAKEDGLRVTFRFIPQMTAWQCKDGKCAQVQTSGMTVDSDGHGRVNGKRIWRRSDCWNQCDVPEKSTQLVDHVDTQLTSRKSTPHPYVYAWIVFVVVLCLMLAAWVLLRR